MTRLRKNPKPKQLEKESTGGRREWAVSRKKEASKEHRTLEMDGRIINLRGKAHKSVETAEITGRAQRKDISSMVGQMGMLAKQTEWQRGSRACKTGQTNRNRRNTGKS